MSILRIASLPALLAATLLLAAPPAHAQLTLYETGFVSSQLSNDSAKQVELGIGPDTCLYYGSYEGLRRRCTPTGPSTICDSTLTFPVGIAFSTGGSFGNAMYVADYAVGNIHRAAGCVQSTPFAPVPGPGAIAFPPAGSAYGDYLYACEAFTGPIYRVTSAGLVTTWLALETLYLRFGPGGVWGTGLYVTDYAGQQPVGLARVTSSGVVTRFVSGLINPEGFDWGFDGDMFATDVGTGQILRVKSNGTTSIFATLAGAADVAYRPGENALYVVSNQGGLYRIRRTSTAGVGDGQVADASPAVSPNPARGACSVQFTQRTSGLARVSVLDPQGRTVRRLPEVWSPAGSHTLAWDGRDDAGSPVHPGSYFMRVVSGGETGNVRVTIIR
ncbi:MAG: FlgD immunoglobulin-like domain containing protein [Candidatus Eisenbacteria bacterium]